MASVPLAQGLGLGLAFAAPIGAQNLYVIRAAATAPLGVSLRVAILVSIADILLGQACLFCAGALLTAGAWLAPIVTPVGICFLVFTGARLVSASSAPHAMENCLASDAKWNWRKVATSAVLVTWVNPQGLMDGPLILGGFRSHLLPCELPSFAAGLACASVMWFFAVTFCVGSFRARISDRLLGSVNKVCGILLCLFALRLALKLG